jgi:tetratricopeptide (TPR) repeat protein
LFRALVLAVVVAVAAFLPFIPSIHAGFCEFDDPGIFKDVTGYQGLSPANLRWMFTTTHMGHYQPLTWLSYAIEYTLWGHDPSGQWGLNPVAYHLSNVVLHCLNAALVFLFARALLGRTLPAATALSRDLAAVGAALLFALHPLRVESVAWVTERRDVLSTFFLLLAGLAYLRAFPPGSLRTASWPAFVGSVALLALSLLSKAWGMTFFVVLIALDWYPLRRLPPDPRRWWDPDARPMLLQKIPFIALGLAATVMASIAQSSIRFNVRPLSDWGIFARAAQAMFGLMFYFQKMVWPTRLACIYEMPRVFDPLEPRFIAAYAFTTALALIAIASWKRWPAVTAAAAVYAVVLAPVLGFHQSGPQLVADRYSYIADIPWAILIAGAAVTAASRFRVALLAGAGAIVVALGAMSWVQCGFWGNSEALFKHAIDVGADGPIAREFYGRQLLERGEREAALAQFERGIEIDPGYPECWFSRANTLRDLGRFPEAEESYMNARRRMADSWRAALKQGMMYLDLADRLKDNQSASAKALQGAADCFRAAVANVEQVGYDPPTGRPYLMLAAALELQGDDRNSRAMLERAAQCPDTRQEALALMRDPAR